MAIMKEIKITIAKDGSYTMKAGSGFSGVSCVQKTQTIEQLIGGGAEVSDRGKTDDYFKADDSAFVMNDISTML